MKANGIIRHVSADVFPAGEATRSAPEWRQRGSFENHCHCQQENHFLLLVQTGALSQRGNVASVNRRFFYFSVFFSLVLNPTSLRFSAVDTPDPILGTAADVCPLDEVEFSFYLPSLQTYRRCSVAVGSRNRRFRASIVQSLVRVTGLSLNLCDPTPGGDTDTIYGVRRAPRYLLN